MGVFRPVIGIAHQLILQLLPLSISLSDLPSEICSSLYCLIAATDFHVQYILCLVFYMREGRPLFFYGRGVQRSALTFWRMSRVINRPAPFPDKAAAGKEFHRASGITRMRQLRRRRGEDEEADRCGGRFFPLPASSGSFPMQIDVSMAKSVARKSYAREVSIGAHKRTREIMP